MESENEQKTNLEHFLAIPWCAKHLNDPQIRIIDPAYNRDRKVYKNNVFWSRTVNTPDTIPYFLNFYRQNGDPDAIVTDFRAFATLESGVTGYPRVIHGGAAMSILDEHLGCMIQTMRIDGILKIAGSMTATFKSTFLAPVPVPSTVLVVGKVVKMDGRKIQTEGWMEDEHGKMLIKAEALWVQIKPKV